jgi:hypothetical protein
MLPATAGRASGADWAGGNTVRLFSLSHPDHLRSVTSMARPAARSRPSPFRLDIAHFLIMHPG